MVLLLKSLTFEHIVGKGMCCKIYTPFEGAQGTSPSGNGNYTISKLQSSRLS